jgi:hypothetical protein
MSGRLLQEEKAISTGTTQLHYSPSTGYWIKIFLTKENPFPKIDRRYVPGGTTAAGASVPVNIMTAF